MSVARLIDKEYVATGKVRVVFKNRAVLAQESAWAAEAAFCAEEQGKFWEYHDKLYESLYAGNREAFSKAGLKGLASQLGLAADTFGACLDGGKHSARVREETAESQSRGVTGTPTFFIDDTKIVGAQSFEAFRAAIEAALR